MWPMGAGAAGRVGAEDQGHAVQVAPRMARRPGSSAAPQRRRMTPSDDMCSDEVPAGLLEGLHAQDLTEPAASLGVGRAHCPCLPENSLTSCLALVGEDRSGGRPVHSDQVLGSKTPTTLFLGSCSWKLDDTVLLLRSGPPGFPGLCHVSQRTSDFALKERQPCGHTGCPRTREMLHARWTRREGGDSCRGPGPSPAGAAPLCQPPWSCVTHAEGGAADA